jgi:hypothetical protein
MSVIRSSAFRRSGPSGSTLVALILTLTLAVILVLTVAIGVAISENVPVTVPSAPLADHSAPALTPDAPASVTILNNHEVEGILGRDVVSTTNENMGHIVDVIVDRVGKVRAAIIDFGGFLGVGSRKIAVEWDALHFPPPGQADAKITLDLTHEQLAAAPEYVDGKPVVVLGALGKLEPLPFE